ncbi:MAG: tRNA (uridine(34)/cytosine(34)/5-carboxymethylaminomethyluridine(34)-2'-O)-methyltransferase TrmL [Neisseriaceae bacterium]|nr:tRNA (uridine(34)/cytosine(34)/5-carboxymethylaminomethyluridine(34)-2'-O)-methyltransferase TrmL [Neisseriaceae bacterium PsAf]MCV2502513.1 tRNA (uridine(34)/cytosine(34)/5-carboxymethylaminomethyluridine(34)-2'-O)-methyltransferase TrmL [Neisseriaceae bacterium]MCV2509443.1 tRNA (uridine(34)/cytosine(34)/5-carboxymethylaminomethyluridine(34)-2'-O)-methyltransferase TrmL [Neisseriaceae bacterium]
MNNHIILFEPEIPQNTGNIIRLCANTGFTLHLVEPLGFIFNSRKMRRAGLDYHEFTSVIIHKTWQECLDCFTQENKIYALTTQGTTRYDQPQFKEGDAFLFGPETRGLPDYILESFSDQQKLRLPMVKGSRSMNLANTVSVMLFEAWRQNNFEGGV